MTSEGEGMMRKKQMSCKLDDVCLISRVQCVALWI